jgi:hypothetical protein
MPGIQRTGAWSAVTAFTGDTISGTIFDTHLACADNQIDPAATDLVTGRMGKGSCADVTTLFWTAPEVCGPVTKYSKYQQNIIKNYYENRDAIALQRVQELVTELYLSEGKKRQRYWEQVKLHLGKLGLPPAQINQVVAQDKPELVAAIVQKLVDKV